MKSTLIVHDPTKAGTRNETVGDLCGLILDNWRKCTPLQVAIAATVIQYARPAECVSRKQIYHIEQGAKNIKAAATAHKRDVTEEFTR